MHKHLSARKEIKLKCLSTVANGLHFRDPLAPAAGQTSLLVDMPLLAVPVPERLVWPLLVYAL